MNNMDSQTPVSIDRSRTYWTPTMERYFIDLMLEHMHRGNRTGHTFNKQAWNDMLLVFNEKFGSQYDKDVLKSRYTNLWKQFNDTKNLLGQSGFSWDDTQQMVVADDHVWDTYTKAHPDARPYKTKPVLNFNDLCLIYGYTVADGRYSRSSHDMDKDDEIHGVNLCDGIGSLASSNGERSRTEWTTDMDQYFLELMLDQQERGNKLDNTFSKQAWTDMLGLFNAKFGDHHTKRVLRHRYRKLFKYHSDVAILLKQNGFSWDEKQKIVAADDDVWNAYIKGHPNARSYRTKCLPNFNDLGLIFGNAFGNKIRYEQQLDKDLEDENAIVKAGSERTRTYWTPPMDRYLINLLLTEVYHGNRIGQTLIGKSWNDMVTSFNENFRSHHDKDVLKNRYKHLRKQYNDVKVLLGQTGFSWDETREMVTAEDHVWDAYIEVHPDARSYRVKTVPSYHKLRIIYGEDSLDGRYSHLACNVGEESKVSLLSTGTYNYERKEHESQSNTIPMIDWTPPMDRYFIDLVLEKVHSGNKVDLTFEDQEWIEMIASFNKRFGPCFDKYVLETRLLCLMKQYRDIMNLLAQQGFAWDDSEQMVTAADAAWEAYSKEHPRAISYRGKCLDNFMDLHTFFGSVMNDDVCESMGLEIDHSLLDMEFVEICEELQISGAQTETSDEGKKRPPITATSARSSKLQKTGKEDIQDAFSDVANIISKLVKGKDAKRHIATERSMDALQAIPDIDNELLLDACVLLEDERKAKTFLALDASLRRKWLLRKLSC